jgi:hypothetical protein
MDLRLTEAYWQPYVQDVALACEAAREDTVLIVAIGLRESNLGRALVPRGPSGRGDGGHGRGLFQIDDRGPWKHLIPADGVEWSVFEQATAACRVIAGAREELSAFQGSMGPRAWDIVVACRYNADLGNIKWALTNGRDPNCVTTPGPFAPVDPATGKRLGDYGADVIKLRDGLRATYPLTFPPLASPAGDVA